MLAWGRVGRKAASEAERPFWISYADLMTAMMMLFLVVMAATIIALTQRDIKKLSEAEVRNEDLANLCKELVSGVGSNPLVSVNCKENRITFPKEEVGYFTDDSYRLPEAAHPELARLVPVILGVADSELGKKWLKRVIIEGYASRKGSYLYNLHLSANRSYWVMCLLTDPKKNPELALTSEQTQRVRQLFRVGGASFNRPADSEVKSRRVEFQLDFHQNAYGEGEQRDSLEGVASSGVERCAL